MSDKTNKKTKNWFIKKLKSQVPAPLKNDNTGTSAEKQKQALKETLAKKLEEALQGNGNLNN